MSSSLPKVSLHDHLNACFSVELIEKFIKSNRIITQHMTEGDEKDRVLRKLSNAEYLIDQLKKRGLHSWQSPQEFKQFSLQVIQATNPAKIVGDMNAHQLFHIIYGMIVDTIRTPENLYELTYEHLRNSARQGAIYVELSTSGLNNSRGTGPLASNITVICNAIKQAKIDFGIEARITITAKRQLDIGESKKLLAACNTARQQSVDARKYITGFGMAGDEHIGNIRDYAGLFAQAKLSGLGTTVHVGEIADVDVGQIREAVDTLKVDRIGHGLKTIIDSDLVEQIKKRGIAIEQCPTSNFLLQEIDYKDHPAKKLMDNGCVVVPGTDDPGLLFPYFSRDQNDGVGGIEHEYNMFANKLGFTNEQLRQLTRNGIKAAFIDEETRKNLLARLDDQIGGGIKHFTAANINVLSRLLRCLPS